MGGTDKSFLMLGKQEMHLREEILGLLDEAGLIENKSRFGKTELGDSVKFFRTWGFDEVHALDVSGYEGADIIFNLNDELPEELEGKFDVVYDGGVIEHVFNVSIALMNICRLVKKGGLIFNLNPVYNYLHNIYWNISPELFMDFYSANEYKILDCSIVAFLSETEEKRSWADRPVIWSPDCRLMDFQHPLQTGRFVSSLNNLCTNPHPHTFIVAQKTHDGKFNYPTTREYARRHEMYIERQNNS
ncbi:MAG: class I SAM-dependent methyltransferase [Lachnospiraceae bacterium]|nr:class I SAM-dependent methyltransferase [Lachnospiraceae bacterium]